MAILKGREVSILGRADGADVSPTYRILDSYGQESQVMLKDLQVTSEEKKQLDIDNGNLNSGVKVISDKDLKDLRDGQDKEKIEARQSKEDNDVTVPVSEIKVDKNKIK
jgi:hypothetical protein